MPIGGTGHIIPQDDREIRWGENGGFIFANPTGVSLHSAFPHAISLDDSHVSFELTMPSINEVFDENGQTYDISRPLVCLTGFNNPIIEFVFYIENQETKMRIRVAGNDSGSYINLNIDYEETYHFEIILNNYTAEIIMGGETLEFSNHYLDEPISQVPVSTAQSYVFIGTQYFSYFTYTLSGIHIETGTYLANSKNYDINYWLGEFESAYNNEGTETGQ